ncbi:hypothetical protein [Pseudoalteromonas piscicida]|uniref:hypothetical protein n=1 Tax=Pseudoalteromonas piscicida TaxID=43662 RepID=UPI000E35AA63|nr:hypothetical protein [Pseudoalteromonas piscicida]AXQ99902.1 hypothetical protein D0N37_20080 [Pseudoalteromonas piscicida]
MDLNNAAGRLLNILAEGKKANPTENCRKVWCKILDVEESESFILIGRIGKVFSLVDDISTELSQIDDVDVSRYMSWTKYLENAFSNCNLGSAWGEFMKQLGEPAFDYLHMTAGMLSSNRPQPILPLSELNQIYSGAKELLEEVINSDLPINIKKYFSEQLRKIIISIEEYKITGSYEVVSIVDATFGKAVLSKDLTDKKDTNTVMKKFWSFMANTALIVSSVSGLLQIADYTAKTFPELNVLEKVINAPVEKK